MANYVTVITDEGAALLASVIANQGTLTISEMRFSEHDYTGTAQTATAGTFTDVFKTASVNSEVTDSTTIKSAASFTNSGITSDHPLYAVGLVGTDGNTTALLCVCTTSDPDYIREPIPISNVSTYGFNINLTVSDTDNITVVGTAALILYSTDVIDNLTSTATNKPLSANQGRVLEENKAERADLSTIHAKGSTNTTGATIKDGTFFYLNGSYCKALQDIGMGATFTLNTNFKVDSVGEVIQEEDISSQITVNTTYFNPSALIAYKKMCNGLKWLVIYAQPITAVPHDTAFMSGFTPDGAYKVCPVYNYGTQTSRFVRIWTNNLGQLMIDDNLSTDDLLIYNDIIR